MVDVDTGAQLARSRRAVLLALTVAAMLPGCASPTTYLSRRGADLADVVDLELTVGPGADLHAHATRWFGTALGWSNQRGLLLHGRYAGTGSRETFGILIGGLSEAEIDFAPPEAHEGRYWAKGGGWALLLAAPPGELGAWPESGLGAWDFGVGTSLGVGVHVGFNPAELLDFATGFFGADLGGDDEPPDPDRSAAPTEEEPESKGEYRFGWTPLHEAAWAMTGCVYFFVGLWPGHI